LSDPSNMTDILRKSFQNILSLSQEKKYIFILTGTSTYQERIYGFNIYLIDRNRLKPSAYSKIAYFELLNSKTDRLYKRGFCLDGGFGPGQIVLPDTLSTGRYTIRAYTNWMKNFLPYNCFMKEINIIMPIAIEQLRESHIPSKLRKKAIEIKLPRYSFIPAFLL